jgi:CheY-like chemotaxis protein
MAIKVLLVEDNPFIQRMYGRAFQEAGLTVLTASDGTTVVDLTLQEHPDIILMDVMMPNHNGLETLKDLKANEQTRNVPVIMISAYEEPSLMQESLQLGANRYLLKSAVEPSTLLAHMHEDVKNAGITSSQQP